MSTIYWSEHYRNDIDFLLSKIHDLQTANQLTTEIVETLREELAKITILATEMAGFVKPFGLNDFGVDSEYEKWKCCAHNIDKLRKLAKAKGSEISQTTPTTNELEDKP